MKLIVDANVLFSALICDSATRKLLMHPDFEFIVPEFVLLEIMEHIDLISKKSKLSTGELTSLLSDILKNVEVVEHERYAERYAEATLLLEDSDDVAYLALALSTVNKGIWTNDKGFSKQNVVKVWTTEELLGLVI